MDNVMIGQLGDAPISGVYIGGQIQTLLQVFSGGIEGAMLILAAQYFGAGDKESIKKITSIGLRFTVTFSALITLICTVFPSFVISLFTKEEKIIEAGSQYLEILAISFIFFCITQALIASMRGVASPKVGLFISGISLICNTGLNYLLIYGKLGFPALGIRGAAIATVISRVIEFLFAIVFVFRIDKKLGMRLKDLLRVDKKLLRDFVKYGLPVMAGQLIWAVNTLSASAIMGRLPYPGVVAGLSLANTLNNLSYVVMNGASGAVGIITGKTIGEGRLDKIREYSYTTQIIFVILGLITGATLQAIKSPYLSLFAISAEAHAEGERLINVLSFTIVGTCYQAACLFGLVKSGGDVTFVMKNDFIFIFFIVLPSAILGSCLGAPAYIVFLLLKSDQILKCFVAAVKINRFKWAKSLTRQK
jgi:putative MATE family efflux protein